jgi:hypothetical protein
MSLVDTLPLSFSTPTGRHVGMTAAALLAHGVPAAEVLAGFRDFLCTRVDAQAEALRLAVLSPGAGQALEYQEAQAQARAALAGPPAEATPVRYAMLAASIGIDRDPQSGALAADGLGVARAVVAAYGAWLEVGAAIRGARLAGKAAIAAAPTLPEAEAAYAAVAWPALG